MKVIQILILCVVLSVLAEGQLYKLIKHPHDRGAYCMDGSPAVMYLHEGKGDNKNKFFIHFCGGGLCGEDTLDKTVQSCYERSDTIFGSSKEFPPFFDFDDFGVLSTKKQRNPAFWDWTKVFAIYCDGTIHEGNRKDPVVYKGKKLYFRGSRNAQEQFYYLDKNYNFYNSDTIVVSGLSAGAVATYYWVDFVRQRAGKNTKVYGMPDSGIFINDYFSPLAGKEVIQERFNNIQKLVGTPDDPIDIPPPLNKCLNDTGNETFCKTTTVYYKYVESPLLIIESPYDQWSIDNIVTANCKSNSGEPYSIQNCNQKQRSAIEDYKQKVLSKIKQIKGNKTNVGVWGPACVQHGYSFDDTLTSPKYEVPTTTGAKLSDAIQQYLQNPNNPPWLLDEGMWPVNTGCSGMKNRTKTFWTEFWNQ